MFTIYHSIRCINSNNITRVIGRQCNQYLKAYMSGYVFEEKKKKYNYNKYINTIESNKTSTLIHANPYNYINNYFWLKILYNNRFAFGIKNEFISDYGNIEYVNIELNPMKRLSYKQYFGDIENNKTVYTLEAPFDNCFVVNNNEDTSLDMINRDPENIKHHLCIIDSFCKKM